MQDKFHKEEKARLRIIRGAHTPEWMLSFGDLVSCLLVFFVLLVTFSTPDEGRLMKAFGAFQGAFGVVSPILPGDYLRSFKEDEIPAGGNIVGGVEEKGTMSEDNLSPVLLKSISVVNKYNDFKGKLLELGFKNSVTAQELNEGLMLRASVSDLFKPGAAEFTEAATRFLVDFANFAGSVGNEINIRACFIPRGSADPGAFPTEWVLARDRSLAIGTALTRKYKIAKSRFSYGCSVVQDGGAERIEFLLVEKLGTSEVSLADILKKLLRTDAKGN